MRISGLTVGAFQENCYLLVDEASSRAVLVDPGAEGDRIVRLVQASGATLDAIWLTHAHVDHVAGIAAVRRAWNVPIHMHPADAPLYERAAMQAAFYGLPFEDPPPVWASRSSLGTPSHFAFAPVATMSARASTSGDHDGLSTNGCWPSSTFSIRSWIARTPKRSACCRIRSTSSGPVIPSWSGSSSVSAYSET